MSKMLVTVASWYLLFSIVVGFSMAIYYTVLRLPIPGADILMINCIFCIPLTVYINGEVRMEDEQ